MLLACQCTLEPALCSAACTRVGAHKGEGAHPQPSLGGPWCAPVVDGAGLRDPYPPPPPTLDTVVGGVEEGARTDFPPAPFLALCPPAPPRHPPPPVSASVCAANARGGGAQCRGGSPSPRAAGYRRAHPRLGAGHTHADQAGERVLTDPFGFRAGGLTTQLLSEGSRP